MPATMPSLFEPLKSFLLRHSTNCHTLNIRQRIISGISINILAVGSAQLSFSPIDLCESRTTIVEAVPQPRAPGVFPGHREKKAVRPNKTPPNRARTTIHCSICMWIFWQESVQDARSEWQSRHGAPSKAIHTLLRLVPEVTAENIWGRPPPHFHFIARRMFLLKSVASCDLTAVPRSHNNEDSTPPLHLTTPIAIFLQRSIQSSGSALVMM